MIIQNTEQIIILQEQIENLRQIIQQTQPAVTNTFIATAGNLITFNNTPNTKKLYNRQGQTRVTHVVMEKPTKKSSVSPEKRKKLTMNGDNIYYPPGDPNASLKFSPTHYLNTNKTNEEIPFLKCPDYTITTLC